MLNQDRAYASRSPAHHQPARRAPGRALAEVMAAALEAADPAAAVRAHLRRDGAAIEVGDRRYEQAGRVLLVGGGKAAAPMAQAALAILGERVSAGVLVTKDGHAGGCRRPAPINSASSARSLQPARGRPPRTRRARRRSGPAYRRSAGRPAA
ncbi:MAG: DUF4147 domain-containing protein [Kouleothrix sp.]